MATLNFTVLSGAVTSTAPIPTYPPLVVTPKWVFQGANVDSQGNFPTYTFAHNPARQTEIFGEAALATEHTTGEDGKVVTWEGAPRAATWSFTGRTLTKYDHDALLYFFQLNGRIWLTDDIGRRFLIKILTYLPTRKRDRDREWHHEYVMTIAVLQGPGVL